MKFGVRDDADQGPTRTIEWADGSSSDVSVFVVFGVAFAVLVVSVLTVCLTSGAVRTASVVVAVLAGIYVGLMLIGGLISLSIVHHVIRLIGKDKHT